MTTQRDHWDELQEDTDLLALAISTGVIRSCYQELPPEPERPWINEEVARGRRRKWRAFDARQRASRALTKKIREIYSDQDGKSA